MSVVVGRAILALVFVAAGALMWRLSEVERSLARASQLAATLSPDAAAAYEDVERSLGQLRRVPRLTDGLRAEVRRARMVADYTAGSFGPLADMNGHHDTGGELGADHLFVATNAAYRLSRRAAMSPEVALRQLDDIAKRYAQVLERQPDHVEAAYNYELVVRLRDRVARTNRGLPPLAPGGWKGDLPVGPTIHGLPGAPPRGAQFGRFDLLIPLEPDEADFPDDSKTRAPRGKG